MPATARARARVSGVRAVFSAGRQGVEGRGRTVVCRADAQLGHPAEQRLMVDLPDGETVVPVVDRGQSCPATGEEHTAALRADRLDGHPGEVGRGVHGHGAEAHVHRRFTGVQERLQLIRERTLVQQDPRAGVYEVESGPCWARVVVLGVPAMREGSLPAGWRRSAGENKMLMRVKAVATRRGTMRLVPTMAPAAADPADRLTAHLPFALPASKIKDNEVHV
ncbi:hypothetical protein GTZ78_26305 [Streptomyces sp. SID8361]|nr:hypothetical protein [Streptomyces sp. SID8361]